MELNPASSDSPTNGKDCHTTTIPMATNAGRRWLNQAKPSNPWAPPAARAQFTIPYWSWNIHRQTMPAATRGMAHGSRTSTPSSARPRKRRVSSAATPSPAAIVATTHEMPKTAVVTKMRRRSGSAAILR